MEIVDYRFIIFYLFDAEIGYLNLSRNYHTYTITKQQSKNKKPQKTKSKKKIKNN